MRLQLRISAFLFFICLMTSANDGAYKSIGGLIYPLNETQISIDKEILSFNIIDKVAQVNVYFEFFNPEQNKRKMLIGFQAPFPSGDAYQLLPENLISNFRVFSDGTLIQYTIKVADCEDCELKDTAALKFLTDEEHAGVFVYLFEVIFKPGINIISHSYNFPASNNVMFNEIYRYIITTGSKWAGGTIKDFTLKIDLNKDTYIYVNDIFPSSAKWTIIGTGKIGEINSDRTYWIHRMVRTVSGKLEISAKDFSPKENIDFGIPGSYSFYDTQSDKNNFIKSSIEAKDFLSINLKEQKNITKNDLLILRNAVYAVHGYKFKNQELLKYFSKLDWYIPDPNISSKKIVLSDQEQNFLNTIIQLSK
jgi:hypothetical protein